MDHALTGYSHDLQIMDAVFRARLPDPSDSYFPSPRGEKTRLLAFRSFADP